ncbi:unnamed protein product [Meloidogyne enterolobii]|uniref:Uncharacterized protein n=1 Tax=Meloidogyne enterolobii TaxID=390850 RepID=A0ACB0Z0E3_MELEN
MRIVELEMELDLKDERVEGLNAELNERVLEIMHADRHYYR